MNKYQAQEWFGTYAGAYLQAVLGGAADGQAHAGARIVADDAYTLQPGTAEFDQLYNQVISDPDVNTGSKFVDNTQVTVGEGNYNFSRLLNNVLDLQVGGDYRQYSLNSGGTIFTDYDGPINYSQYGAYAQASKKFTSEERMKLTASIRMDKNEFFDASISPRVSLTYSAGDKKQHNLRASYQTGFRNPTTQDLFIGLDAGRAILVGSAPSNLDRWTRNYDVSASGQALGVPASVPQTGAAAYNNSFTLSSVGALSATGNPAVLEAANPDVVKPEQVTSVEVGYRGKFGKLIVDFSAYHNTYEDFISQETVIAPLYGTVGDNALSVAAIANGDFQAYSTYTNSKAAVKSYGASLGLSAKVFGNFDLSGSYTYAKLDFDRETYPDFTTNFNTPEHKFKASFGNTEVFENFGFNVSYRYSDDYYWEATFGNGIVPEFHVLDAQINLKVPSFKSTFKAGATNLLGDEYFTAFGTGFIGSMLYVGWTINNL